MTDVPRPVDPLRELEELERVARDCFYERAPEMVALDALRLARAALAQAPEAEEKPRYADERGVVGALADVQEMGRRIGTPALPVLTVEQVAAVLREWNTAPNDGTAESLARWLLARLPALGGKEP